MADHFPRLHLLGLPREIRNVIYSYLTRPIHLNGVNEVGGMDIAIELDNAPELNVLLVHSRLHDEYKESTCFTDSSASLSTGLEIRMDGLPVERKRDIQALSYVKAITLHSMHFSFIDDESHKLLSIVDALLDMMPQVHTLRLKEMFPFVDTPPKLLSMECHQRDWRALKLSQVASGQLEMARVNTDDNFQIPLLLTIYSSNCSKIPMWTRETACDWDHYKTEDQADEQRGLPNIANIEALVDHYSVDMGTVKMREWRDHRY
ncbi:hypothetical protein E8E13_003019 [Curvularia kusanoi]|uniref:Uncharacterized protein n=1 Tax=Curvularia kusanoi TaxID=90978 RepID=A0A9P4WDU3_CURKU|nr:hypothetical protein E8E13_003019 [Curvularia kusanoi]